MRRSGSTGRSTPASFATLAAHGPAQFTTLRVLTEPRSLVAFWHLAAGFGAAWRRRREIMARRKVSDPALARWFQFQPAAEPIAAEPVPEPAAGLLAPV